jgi:DNA adenine methylase
MRICSPFKWPGGKSRIFHWFQQQSVFQQWKSSSQLLPYVEPFCGGASFFFEYFYQHPSWLNDTSVALMQTYQGIQVDPLALWHAVEAYQDTEENFFQVRSTLNGFLERKESNPLEVGTRFLILNRYGFNGLWRQNSKGLCNTPWGRGTVKKSIDSLKDKLIGAHQKLQGVQLTMGSVFACVEQLHTPSLVYCDPPYLGDSALEFTGYSQAWTQIHLRQLAAWVHAHPEHRVVISQPDNALTRSVWSDFQWLELEEQRNISCKERGKARELLVMSWLPA